MGGGLVFELTQEVLHEALDYDKELGVFTWKVDRPLNHFKNSHAKNTYMDRFAGKRAGYASKYGKRGLYYLQIRIKGKIFLAHRLAWFYVNGVWPSEFLDHKDGDGLNNKWVNLREVTRTINGRNCGLSLNNTSGVNGVYWNKANQKWVAEGHYTENGVKKKKNLGSYTNLEDARIARECWQKEKGDFTERHGK